MKCEFICSPESVRKESQPNIGPEYWTMDPNIV